MWPLSSQPSQPMNPWNLSWELQETPDRKRGALFFRPFQLAVRRDSNVPCWKWPGLSQSTSRAEPREAPVCRGGFFDEFGTWELWLLPSCLGVGAVRGSPGSPDPRKKRGDIIVIFYDILQIIWETPSLTTDLCTKDTKGPRCANLPATSCMRPRVVEAFMVKTQLNSNPPKEEVSCKMT